MNPQDLNNEPAQPPQPGVVGPSGTPQVSNDQPQTPERRGPVPVSDFRSYNGPGPSQDIVRPTSSPVSTPPTQDTSPTPEAAAPTPPAAPAATPAPKRSTKPMGAIFAAVFIAIALSGLSVFAYLKTQGGEKPAATQPAATQPAAAAQDVDTTAQEIDKTLESANQAGGLGSNDLSDQSLGL